MPPIYHRTWQYLKYSMNHRPERIPMRDGTFLEILPGQHLFSIRDICKAVGYYERRKWQQPNPKTINDVLKWMERNSMISVNHGNGNSKYTLITLLNWDIYQSKLDEGNAKVTLDKQSLDINKNDQEGFKKKDLTTAADNSVRNGEDGGVPTTEIVQPAQVMGGRGQIPQSSEAQLLEKYLQLRGNGFFTSPKDDEAAKEILAKIPIDKALQWLEDVFQSYRPKHPRDRINSLDYCVGPIFDRMAAEQQREQQRFSEHKQKQRPRQYGQQHHEVVPKWMKNSRSQEPEISKEEAQKRAEWLDEYLNSI